MASEGGSSSDAGADLEQILEDYFEKLADGDKPDQQRYLDAHPEMADALRGVFRTLDFIETTGRSLRATGLEAGQMLGEFRIVREIGRGGMGVVYEAEQTSMGRRVALKVLALGALLADTSVQRFSREAATAGNLHHSNIVPVFAVGEADGIHFYAMQFIDGPTLAGLLAELRAGGRLGTAHHRRVAKWGRQIASALDYAHTQGTIHRDIKPSNLLLDSRDDVWVTDFGLARTSTAATLTASGDVVGTARYMSPEQAGGAARVDQRTDIYSLGATLYELLTLVPPAAGETREEVLNRILIGEPAPVNRLDRRIPRDLATIVAKCMEKEVSRRYHSAAEVAEDLRRFLAGDAILARRPSLATKVIRWVRKNPVHTAGGLLATGLAVGVVLLLLQASRERGRRDLEESLTVMLFDRDFGRAAELLDAAEAAGVGGPELSLRRGLVALLDGRTQQAVEPLEQALQADRDDVEANLALAFAHTASGDFHSGRRIFERVATDRIDTALGWLLHGINLSLVTGSSAIASFDRALDLRPDFVPAISARANYRGLRLLGEGDRAELDAMLDDCDALVVFRPKSSQAYCHRALGWLSAAAFAGTQADLREMQQTWLSNCRADIDRGLALRREDDSMALVVQGKCASFAGDHDLAKAAFGKAIEVERAAARGPDAPLVHMYSMELYCLGDLQAALDVIAATRAQAPSYYPIMLEQAILQAELGELDRARETCREVMAQQQGNATALAAAVATMELLGDPAAGTVALREFFERRAEGVTSEDVSGDTAALTMAYLSGTRSKVEVLAATQVTPGARCDVTYLIAMRELGRGDREAGLQALSACLGTGVHRYGYYRFAQAMLARSRAVPGWPRWLPEER